MAIPIRSEVEAMTNIHHLRGSFHRPAKAANRAQAEQDAAPDSSGVVSYFSY